ncbi:LuxR family transcriptional regulator [Rhodobacteraceae bacterium CCMM004]|nr:LuxR family transcriptional regulator [Rhodobacteraceae bacterium CCMM004]
MKGRLDDLIEIIRPVASLDELSQSIARLRDLLDIDHIVYHAVNASGGQFAALTYPDPWVTEYLDRGYQRTDPVVRGCMQTFHPVDWKTLDWSSRGARDFLGEAMAAGVGNQGVSVPIRGPGGQFALFTANHRCDDDTWARYSGTHLSRLILLAHFVHQKALEVQAGAPPPLARLSPRETDALTLLARGKSRAQAADELVISEHTLRVYIEAARDKLGALNTTHAVACALHGGLIVI